MTELLHAWAIAPAAIGACCLAAERGRARWPDAVASLLMLVAMLDAALSRLVAPVYWAAALMVCAMALAAVRRPRRRTASPRGVEAAMTVHTGLGLVAMAALQLTMGHDASGETMAASASAHAHAGGGALLGALMIGGALAYAGLSVLLLPRTHRTLERAQVICMGASVVVMAAGTLA